MTLSELWMFSIWLFQIGNAVPPPMAREIGHEIKKCLIWKAENGGKKSNVRPEASAKKVDKVDDTNSDVQMIDWTNSID